MKTFGWSERYVKWGMMGKRTWAFYNWAIEHESSMFGSGLVMVSDGYVAQEIKTIRERKKKK